MKVYKVNGLWCLADKNGYFLCSLLELGNKQPATQEEAEKLLLAKFNSKPNA